MTQQTNPVSNRKTVAVVITLALINSLPLAKADDTKRIQFGKGKDNITLTGELPAYEGTAYIIEASKKQTIWLKATENSKQILADFGKYSFEAGDNFTMQLPDSKDYHLSLSNPTDKPLPYSLYIKIR